MPGQPSNSPSGGPGRVLIPRAGETELPDLYYLKPDPV